MPTGADSQTPAPLAPGLYLVATPIGHLRDITLRALDVLKASDLVACEDTRVTGKLMAHYGIRARLVCYNDHNAGDRRPEVMDALLSGQRVALVSDAGTPLISDPGYKLVREAAEAGVRVVPIPGASSVLAALCASGLPTDRFCFAGFLPPKAAARDKTLRELSTIPASLVFFESTRRLPETLAAMARTLGDRDAAVGRELTKLFEEFRRGILPDLSTHYAQAGAPKGEAVIVIGPPLPAPVSAQDADALLREALLHGSVKDAAARVAEQTGLSRQILYAKALEWKRE